MRTFGQDHRHAVVNLRHELGRWAGGEGARSQASSLLTVQRDHMLAKPKGRPDLSRTKNRVLLRPSFFLHS